MFGSGFMGWRFEFDCFSLYLGLLKGLFVPSSISAFCPRMLLTRRLALASASALQSLQPTARQAGFANVAGAARVRNAEAGAACLRG